VEPHNPAHAEVRTPRSTTLHSLEHTAGGATRFNVDAHSHRRESALHKIPLFLCTMFFTPIFQTRDLGEALSAARSYRSSSI
jgi:hypothetical protein